MAVCRGGSRLASSPFGVVSPGRCSHLTSLRWGVALGEIGAPPPYDEPRGDVLRQGGIERERRLPQRFAAEGRSADIVTAADAPLYHRYATAATARTRDAMRRGRGHLPGNA